MLDSHFSKYLHIWVALVTNHMISCDLFLSLQHYLKVDILIALPWGFLQLYIEWREIFHCLLETLIKITLQIIKDVHILSITRNVKWTMHAIYQLYKLLSSLLLFISLWLKLKVVTCITLSFFWSFVIMDGLHWVNVLCWSQTLKFIISMSELIYKFLWLPSISPLVSTYVIFCDIGTWSICDQQFFLVNGHKFDWLTAFIA